MSYSNNEYISYKSCDEIENKLEFGEVITKYSQQYRELINIIKTFNINTEKLITFFNDDNIMFYDNENNIDCKDHHNLTIKNLLLVDLDD